MTGLIIGIVILVLSLSLFYAYRIGKSVGDAELYEKILKNNPDYFLTEDLKIEKIWCIPD
jgi:hypothetical protein